MKYLYLLLSVVILSCTKTETIIIEPEPEPTPCVCIQSTYERIVEDGQPPIINDALLSAIEIGCQDEVDFKEIERNSSGNQLTWYKIECE